MSITGTLNFDFETEEPITEEQFMKFEKKIKAMIDDWEMMVFDAASESGFEIDGIHPILLDDLQYDPD
jgi:hypothetical protein